MTRSKGSSTRGRGNRGGALLARGKSEPRAQLALLAVIITIFTLSLFPLLGRPFLVGHDGYNGAGRSMGAVNTLRFGLLATRAGATREYWDEVPKEKPRFYTSHPYGHPLLLVAAYAMFGESERVGRSLSFTFCLGLLLLLYLFGRRLRAPTGGLVAAGTAASLPIMHKYGPMINCQIPSLPFVVALYLCYSRCLVEKRPSAATAAGLILSVLGAGLLDWHVFFHLPFLMVHVGWRMRGEPKRVARLWVLLGLAAGIPLIIFLLHTYWLDGFPYLMAKLRQRTGLAPAVSFGWGEFFLRQWEYLCSMYRPATALAAMAGLAMRATGPAGKLQSAGRLSASAALLETLFFNEAVYIHDYFTFVWILPVSLGVASLVERLAEATAPVLCAAVVAVLLGALFASAVQQVRADIRFSRQLSLPLITVARGLDHRLTDGEKVVIYGRPTQFERQIAYYLRHRHFYARGAPEASMVARRCRDCRFLIVKAGDPSPPNARALREAMLAQYPHELTHGYYIFTLDRRDRPAGPKSGTPARGRFPSPAVSPKSDLAR